MVRCVKKEIIEELCEEYQKYESGKATGMKYMFRYHGMEISIYFDGYDEMLPLINIIMNYEGERCFFSCNSYQLSAENLKNGDLTPKIRDRIEQQGGYTVFVERMYQELMSKQYVFRNYKADLMFKHMEERRYREIGIYPFIGCIEQGRMEEEYMKCLHKYFSLSWELLVQIQNKGMILRTVERCKERKKIARELAKIKR